MSRVVGVGCGRSTGGISACMCVLCVLVVLVKVLSYLVLAGCALYVCVYGKSMCLCTSVLMESLHFQVDPVLITGIAPDGCLLTCVYLHMFVTDIAVCFGGPVARVPSIDQRVIWYFSDQEIFIGKLCVSADTQKYGSPAQPSHVKIPAVIMLLN